MVLYLALLASRPEGVRQPQPMQLLQSPQMPITQVVQLQPPDLGPQQESQDHQIVIPSINLKTGRLTLKMLKMLLKQSKLMAIMR